MYLLQQIMPPTQKRWDNPAIRWQSSQSAPSLFRRWQFWELLKHHSLRNKKNVPCFYQVIEVWENEKCCGNTSSRQVFPQLFRVLPNFHKCFYNSIETRSTCLLFLLENILTKKRKMTCKFWLSKHKFSLLTPSLHQKHVLVLSPSS